MSEKVKLSKDGSSIDFVQTDNLPTSMKKFRQSPEIEGFYRFIFENDLQREALEILGRIIGVRKSIKAAEKAAVKAEKHALKKATKEQLKAEIKQEKKAALAPVVVKKPAKLLAPEKPAVKPAAKVMAPKKPVPAKKPMAAKAPATGKAKAKKK